MADAYSKFCYKHRKASQWGFTMSTYDTAVVDHLANLPPEDVLYVTYATLDDDTGNRYLQGYIKTLRRLTICKIKDLIGPAIFSIVTRVLDILVEIQLQSSYSEFGDPRTARLSGFRNDLIAFKDGTNQTSCAPSRPVENKTP